MYNMTPCSQAEAMLRARLVPIRRDGEGKAIKTN
jgi:hypothetical protein